MKALLALIALVLLGAAAPANRPSFACTGNLTPTEAAICADPELAAWDRAVAKVYRVQRKSSDALPRDQRQWISRRDECVADHACLKAIYREWPGWDSMASGFGINYERLGTRPKDPGYLEVLPIYGGWHFIRIDALHIQNARTGGVNTGEWSGLVELRGGKATIDDSPGKDYACRFHLEQIRRGWSIEEFGDRTQCGGLNVSLSGTYLPAGKRMRM